MQLKSVIIKCSIGLTRSIHLKQCALSSLTPPLSLSPLTPTHSPLLTNSDSPVTLQLPRLPFAKEHPVAVAVVVVVVVHTIHTAIVAVPWPIVFGFADRCLQPSLPHSALCRTFGFNWSPDVPPTSRDG